LAEAELQEEMDIKYGDCRGIYSIRRWINSRIVLTLLRILLGIILLSDLSFQATYNTVHQFAVIQAGQSQMNASLAHERFFNISDVPGFWWYFPSLLVDAQVSQSVQPLSCSGPSCNAFFLPGPLSTVLFDPTLPNITNSEYSEATSYIQPNAPGYQFDYFPIDKNVDPAFTLDDCHVYGDSTLAVQVCLKKSNASLLAGIPLISCIDNSMEFMSVGADRCE
jgi:hypothetical protein